MHLCNKDLPDFPMITPNEHIHYVSIENTFLNRVVIDPQKEIPGRETIKKQNVAIRIGLESGDSQICFLCPSGGVQIFLGMLSCFQNSFKFKLLSLNSTPYSRVREGGGKEIL